MACGSIHWHWLSQPPQVSKALQMWLLGITKFRNDQTSGGSTEREDQLQLTQHFLADIAIHVLNRNVNIGYVWSQCCC